MSDVEPLTESDCPQSWHLSRNTGRCPECGMSALPDPDRSIDPLFDPADVCPHGKHRIVRCKACERNVEPLTESLDHVDNERPDPPIHLSSEAAYGWECGWSAAVAALRVELAKVNRHA